MSVLTRRNLLHAGLTLSTASLVAARTAHAGTLFDLHVNGSDPSRDPGKHQEQIEANPECAHTTRGADPEKIAATWTRVLQ